MALMDLIKARHSIRKYTDEQIRREDLDTILEAGNYASKEQPSTIDDPSIKNGFYDAPTVVCVFCQDNFLFKTADAFCMMENMILQATELGIASCIISRGAETFDSEEGREMMRLKLRVTQDLNSAILHKFFTKVLPSRCVKIKGVRFIVNGTDIPDLRCSLLVYRRKCENTNQLHFLQTCC